NEPVELARPDARVADAMDLPGAGNGERSRVKRGFAAIDGDSDATAFKERDFDTFVPVPGQSPALRAGGVPMAHGLYARERARREFAARVVSMDKRAEFNFTA